MRYQTRNVQYRDGSRDLVGGGGLSHNFQNTLKQKKNTIHNFIIQIININKKY